MQEPPTTETQTRQKPLDRRTLIQEARLALRLIRRHLAYAARHARGKADWESILQQQARLRRSEEELDAAASDPYGTIQLNAVQGWLSIIRLRYPIPVEVAEPTQAPHPPVDKRPPGAELPKPGLRLIFTGRHQREDPQLSNRIQQESKSVDGATTFFEDNEQQYLLGRIFVALNRLPFEAVRLIYDVVERFYKPEQPD